MGILKSWNYGKKKKAQEKNKRMGWNIYDPGETYHQHQKNFWHVHYVFKYRLFLPVIQLFGKVMGKYLKKSVPEDPHNINIKLFHESVDKAIHTWSHDYMRLSYKQERTVEWADKFKNCYSNQVIRLMRDTVITMLLYDSAYRELFNIWAHQFTKDMAKHHTNNGTRDKTGHLLFSHGDVYDVDYYILFKKVEVQRYMALHNTDQEKYSEERLSIEEELKHRSEQKNI